MSEVYLALGSNVGDKQANIHKAIALLEVSLKSVRKAPLYRSKAVGYTDQADFINTAISGKTDLRPEELLQLITSIERQVGRIKRFKWGPREIDIDLIFYDGLIQIGDKLAIPHPLFRDRDFVLRPLIDLNPDLVDPVSHKSVTQLLSLLDKSKLSVIS
jgi:2-amino-4-hydroxy-6-hydroxymethyldihydropteridine diphosphokinase